MATTNITTHTRLPPNTPYLIDIANRELHFKKSIINPVATLYARGGEKGTQNTYLTKAGDPARATHATVCASPNVVPSASCEGVAFFVKIEFKL